MGLLHDPALKSLQDNSGRGGNGFWRELQVMKDWTDNQWDPEKKGYIVNGEKVNGKAGTAALAGSLAGYDLTFEEIKHWTANKKPSRPYIAVFSFTPVQELIKASRKMRDFWAGSWILHYLSARICWAIAWKYGPDTIPYKSIGEK